MKKTILLAGILALAPIAPALAEDDEHARDHYRHYRFHDRADEIHERAHDEGFYSRREHRKFHHALRHQHQDFHEDAPGTGHDHD